MGASPGPSNGRPPHVPHEGMTTSLAPTFNTVDIRPAEVYHPPSSRESSPRSPTANSPRRVGRCRQRRPTVGGRDGFRLAPRPHNAAEGNVLTGCASVTLRWRQEVTTAVGTSRNLAVRVYANSLNLLDDLA